MKKATILIGAIINLMCIANADDAKVNLKLILPETIEYSGNNNIIRIPVDLDVNYDSEDYDAYLQCPVILNKDGRLHLASFCDVHIVDDKGNNIAVFENMPNFADRLTLLVYSQSRAKLSLARSISANIDKPGKYCICVIFDVTDNKGSTLRVRGDAKFVVRGKTDSAKPTQNRQNTSRLAF